MARVYDWFWCGGLGYANIVLYLEYVFQLFLMLNTLLHLQCKFYIQMKIEPTNQTRDIDRESQKYERERRFF